MSVRWGLLSTAAINDAIIAACAELPDAQIEAVASRDEGRARDYADRRGIPRAHGSYEALLADPDVDAVYVSLPNALHMAWTVAALEAGKHVLCEKPLGRSPRSVAQAFELADDRGLLLREAFMYRWHPQTDLVLGLVADGAIGAPSLLRMSHAFAMADPVGDVRMVPSLDGGALMDLGCYGVSAARLLLGEPTAVHGHADDGADVDVRFHATLAHADRAVAQFDCAMDLPRRHGLELVGSEGRIVLDDPWHCHAPSFALEAGGRRREIAVPVVDPYRVQLERFGAAIEDRGPQLPFGCEDAVAQASVLRALTESARQGSVVSMGSLVP